MALNVTVTPASSRRYEACTVNITGASATTMYTVLVKRPSGTGHVTVTTDGSGNASFQFQAAEEGNTTFEVRPTAEFKGTTAAAATVTHTGLKGN